MLIHMVEDEATFSALGASSKLNAEHAFIEMLFHRGRAAAETWLDAHFADIGERSSIDIRKLFMGEEDALDGYRINRQARFKQRAKTRAPRNTAQD